MLSGFFGESVVWELTVSPEGVEKRRHEISDPSPVSIVLTSSSPVFRVQWGDEWRKVTAPTPDTVKLVLETTFHRGFLAVECAAFSTLLLVERDRIHLIPPSKELSH